MFVSTKRQIEQLRSLSLSLKKAVPNIWKDLESLCSKDLSVGKVYTTASDVIRRLSRYVDCAINFWNTRSARQCQWKAVDSVIGLRDITSIVMGYEDIRASFISEVSTLQTAVQSEKRAWLRRPAWTLPWEFDGFALRWSDVNDIHGFAFEDPYPCLARRKAIRSVADDITEDFKQVTGFNFEEEDTLLLQSISESFCEDHPELPLAREIECPRFRSPVVSMLDRLCGPSQCQVRCTDSDDSSDSDTMED
jgi:hypothetical protein